MRAPDTDSQLPVLRLWLRLLACTNLIEGSLGQSLRQRFGSTLPRFDLLSQLHRHPEGLLMSELSRQLMVTGGNVTGLADSLQSEGLIRRESVEGDRRATRLRLTDKGKARFEEMAAEHEGWVSDMFSALNPSERQGLHELLGKLKQGLSESLSDRS
jgi:DNA-binding MarR family transcriptional regulator